MERLFNLDFQLITDASLMLIAVFVLFLFMSYFLFNPARKMLEGRKEKIKNELDSAQKDMADAKELKLEYEAKLKDIDKEADEILSEARKKALANAAKIEAEAKEEAARIMERARQEAELEKQKAADDVKKEMISVATVLAEKAVGASMDHAIQDRLVEETLKEIGEGTWLN